MNNIPEPWRQAMVRAGMTDPRYADPRPSLGRLAEKAGIHTTTVSRMVHGTRAPSPANVQAVADALRVDVVEVSKWVRQARTVSKPYQVPPEVNLLDDREQAAITELIRAMAASKESDGRGHAAPTTQAGGDPAPRGSREGVDVPGASDSGVQVAPDEVAHRRRALKADRIAADEVPNAARHDEGE